MMTISPNNLMGSLVYRTRQALNGNAEFLRTVAAYYYAPGCLTDGQLSLRHFPDTAADVSQTLLNLAEVTNETPARLPAVINFQSVRVEKKGSSAVACYDLAIVGAVKNDWTPQQRESELFDKLLRPVYFELMRQIGLAEYLQLDYGTPAHSCYEVFAPGGTAARKEEVYGTAVSAIELQNLMLPLRGAMSRQQLQIIETENNLVTDHITHILNH